MYTKQKTIGSFSESIVFFVYKIGMDFATNKII